MASPRWARCGASGRARSSCPTARRPCARVPGACCGFSRTSPPRTHQFDEERAPPALERCEVPPPDSASPCDAELARLLLEVIRSLSERITMSLFRNPFDSRPGWGCACGRHASTAEHEAGSPGAEELSARALRAAALRALFPKDAERRRFLRAVGRPTAMAALGRPTARRKRRRSASFGKKIGRAHG